jgi:exopolyphosphatase/guanosine-5'-triphosphate,3'-diphosphate pyrophosphatase
MRVAVVDMGTNSTRLLVADVNSNGVHEVERETRVTRLGRGVDHSGHLTHEAIEETCAAVADYIRRYRELDADRVVVIATSAVRDAKNGDAFAAELRERFALNTQILDGSQEAWLTFLGACANRDGFDDTLVIDIGGGSTELIVGAEEEMSFHASLQCGVVRHTERHICHDPPSTAELEELAADIRKEIDGAMAADPTALANEAIAVAGTPTSLGAIDLELDPYDPERTDGHRLSLEKVQRLLSRLASLPLAERLNVKGLSPGRAPTIIAGVVILVEIMRAFGLDAIEVSERDILHGAALDATFAAA